MPWLQHQVESAFDLGEFDVVTSNENNKTHQEVYIVIGFTKIGTGPKYYRIIL